MGSSYFGEPNMGNERSNSGGSSSSSRKGKKGSSSNSEKPKQPQRGLGVAQLEKIRLHSQLAAAVGGVAGGGGGGGGSTSAAAAAYNHHPNSFQSPYHHHHHHHHHPITLNQQHEDLRMQTAFGAVPSQSPFSYSASSSSSSYGGFHPNMMMGFNEMERANIRYVGDSQPSTTPRWNLANGILESQHCVQPNITKHLLNLGEDSLQKKRKKDRNDLKNSSSQNSDSSEELDLELRLSL